jgi:hypothetical protein
VGRGFSPVVEGRASGLSGTKRPSPDVADVDEPPPAKRPALAAEAASKPPPAVGSAIGEEAAKHSTLSHASEQPHAAEGNGSAAQPGVGLGSGELLQQAAGAADSRAAESGGGLASPKRSESEMAQPSAGSAAERPIVMRPGADAGGGADDETLTSQDSVEPGELV